MTSGAADVIVIGAGVAGLSAAQRLAAGGLQVTLLEGRERVGGRIFTQHHHGYPVELGAEFVHGHPAEILDVARARNLKLAESKGEFRGKIGGSWEDSENLMSEVDALFDQIPEHGPDQSFRQYIEATRHSRETKDQAMRFVEGFHAADPDRVGIHWLRKATEAEEAVNADAASRFEGGYRTLVEALSDETDGLRLILNTRVDAIRWRPGSVVVETGRGNFRAPRAVITLPLGVLHAGSVEFDPPLAEKDEAMRLISMGPVIRVSLCFKDRFWESDPHMRDLSFLLTDQSHFPTWWTPNPLPYPVLTGWAAGSNARELIGKSEEQLTEAAMRALAAILDRADLESKLEAGFVHDWQRDVFARGAYSYGNVGGADAPARLASPISSTLFFAGEATNSEGHNGTVNGAIHSGIRVAREVMDQP